MSNGSGADAWAEALAAGLGLRRAPAPAPAPAVAPHAFFTARATSSGTVGLLTLAAAATSHPPPPPAQCCEAVGADVREDDSVWKASVTTVTIRGLPHTPRQRQRGAVNHPLLAPQVERVSAHL